MSPNKQRFVGIAGCRLIPGRSAYRLENGTSTTHVAVTVSLLLAEPCLRKHPEAVAIACEDAAVQGYRLVRSYDDAVSNGLV